MHFNGFNAKRDPILEPIQTIRNTDAIIDLTDPENPKEPEWPEADVIVGNPPFVGGNKIRAALSEAYVDPLFDHYRSDIPATADLCCYWFHKARKALTEKRVSRVGLLATQAIRGGANRTVIEAIKRDGDLFFAVSDQTWMLDGAAVHVSLIGFDGGHEKARALDGTSVSAINANLTAGADTTAAKSLLANRDFCFYGSQQKASFDIEPSLAFEMLQSPNASGRPNSDVIKPSLNGAQLTRRTHESFVIDFGQEESVEVVAHYEHPFAYVEKTIFPARENHAELRQKNFWWLHARPSPRYREWLTTGNAYVVTPCTAKHRLFVMVNPPFLVDHATAVFATDQHWHLGLLHSRIFETWTRSQGTQVRERESGFRFTPSSCFETFPFPEPTAAQRDAIAAAAKELDTLRSNWLNPPEWTREEVLTFPGSVDGPWARYVTEPNTKGIGTVRYPRTVPADAAAAKTLAKRTLTNLYNERPTWLALAHKRVDEAVFAAYGWPADLTDDDLLARLLALNLERSA
jgi:type II restriction/modification system DNA methylase subunit YeeA